MDDEMSEMVQEVVSDFLGTPLVVRQARIRVKTGILPGECLEHDFNVIYKICKYCGVSLGESRPEIYGRSGDTFLGRISVD
jgi:hypothetical protein